jgi:hypothetical protein
LAVSLGIFEAVAVLRPLAQIINCGFEEIETGLAAAVTSNLPGVQDGPCTEKPRKKCKDEFPKLIPVDQLGYPYTSNYQAVQAARAAARPQQIQLGAAATATDGPCGASQSQYLVGTHQNVYAISKRKGRQGYVGDIVMCPCCDDSSGQPMPTQRWNFIR